MRRRVLLLAAVVLVLVTADLVRAPGRQLTARAAIAGIHLYQATLSRAFAASGVACRFSPTCSHYAEACVRRYGAGAGRRTGRRARAEVRPVDAGGHPRPATDRRLAGVEDHVAGGGTKTWRPSSFSSTQHA